MRYVRDRSRLLQEMVVGLLALGCIGLIAIAVSGGVALGMSFAFGRDFVAGNPPGIVYTAERCEYLLEYYPNPANDCARAAVDDHFDETVQYRVLLLVPGAIALGAFFFFRRRWLDGRLRTLPAIVVPTAGAVAFGLAALGLASMSFEELAFKGTNTGAGAFLSGAIVSAVVFAAFLVTFFRMLPPDAPLTAIDAVRQPDAPPSRGLAGRVRSSLTRGTS